MANIFEPEFDDVRERPGFAARRARIGRQLGAERLGFSLWELPPGEAAYPYHFHLGDEELIVVLEGAPELRTPDGRRRLQRGEVVDFPLGERGAHQLRNDTDAVVRFLAFSTQGAPDVVIYPDSDKLGATERLPYGGGLRRFYRLDDDVDLYDGEPSPG